MLSDGETLRCGSISLRGGIPRLCSAALGMTFAVVTAFAGPVAPPPAGKLYHGFYFGGIGTDTHDPTEHDVLPQDVDRYGKRSAQKPPGFTFLITGSNRASFRPRLVPGFGIVEKSLTYD